MKTIAIRGILAAAVIIGVSIAGSEISRARKNAETWSVQQLRNGDWQKARFVNGVWAEEFYYTEDMGRMLEHRYWDSFGRMVEIEYDDDGKVRKKSVRE